jgi:hypothetical protein
MTAYFAGQGPDCGNISGCRKFHGEAWKFLPNPKILRDLPCGQSDETTLKVNGDTSRGLPQALAGTSTVALRWIWSALGDSTGMRVLRPV